MSKKKNNPIFILAGEASGDMYGALLAERIKTLCKDCELYGMGGSHMYNAGVKTLADPTKIAVIGLWEVLKHFGEFKHIFDTMLKYILDLQPKVIVLIDYPGFNLRLARKIKQIAPHINIVYYISPQLWAWGKRRIKLIKKYIDKMLVIFPFEEDFYHRHGIERVVFVGHPLKEALENFVSTESDDGNFIISKNKKRIVLLPGSREREVVRHLPVFLKAVKLMNQDRFQFVIHKAQTVQSYVYREILDRQILDIPLIERPLHLRSFRAASFAWVASGTATVETAFYGLPMIVVYKISPISYFLLKNMVKIRWISMVNIILQEEVVPELIQQRFTPNNLALTTHQILSDNTKLRYISRKFAELNSLLYKKNASSEAANEILKFVS